MAAMCDVIDHRDHRRTAHPVQVQHVELPGFELIGGLHLRIRKLQAQCEQTG